MTSSKAVAPATYANGTMITAVGNGEAGFVADGGSASGTKLNQPRGLTVDREGNLHIVDRSNNRVRKVTPDGIITTVAGNGQAGFASDGGPGLTPSCSPSPAPDAPGSVPRTSSSPPPKASGSPRTE
ncbi:hypothetical protein [Streptomyces sp. NPDC053069]|uniref:NHL domain-containing protein n=1 Tax=Streptomyces sp. NPDC053069 TaxID=3365695 RepID=UPI0037D24159